MCVSEIRVKRIRVNQGLGVYDSKMSLTPFLYKEVFLLGMRHAEDVNSKSSSFDLILGSIICGDENPTCKGKLILEHPFIF
jgi:hypothetical protein